LTIRRSPGSPLFPYTTLFRSYGVAMCAFAVLVAVYAWPWMLALAAAFGIGIVTGFIIGFFVAKVGIPSFVVTLGLFLGYQGLELDRKSTRLNSSHVKISYAVF